MEGNIIELRMSKYVKGNFGRFFPIVMILMILNEVIFGFELQYFGFDELEDLGRIIFVLIVKACESALITVLLLWLYTRIKSVYKNP